MEINDPFEEFLRKNTKGAQNEFNSEDRLKQWSESVDKLYKTIEDWLRPVIRQGLISVKRKEFAISEDFLGQYTIEKMDLFVGVQILTLKPIGTLIMGSLGRIDFVGPHGVYMLIQREWNAWFVSYRSRVSTRPKYVPLNNDVLKIAIQDLIQGTDAVFR